ncbi:MAG: replication initiator protein A, partial [Aliishimia sp.]
GGYVMREEGEWRLDYCEVVLSDWFMRAIEANEVVSISEDYFRLRRPLERRIYEIARKHCGNQKRWHIKLANLQDKTGSNAPLKKFRLNIRQIIENDHLPFYQLALTADDLVIFRPRQNRVTTTSDIVLPEWAEEKAREVAREKGWDYHALRANWMDFAHEATGKGNPPQNAGAAFVAYCKKQDSFR